MNHKLLRERLQQSEERNAVLTRDVAALRMTVDQVVNEIATCRRDYEALRRDYESLVDATRVITDERNLLRQKVAELEAANDRLTDMRWGRQSERRNDSPDQLRLNFGDDNSEPIPAEEQKIITAQAEADKARDLELIQRLEAQRLARREQRKQEHGREEFPPHIERRTRVIDLTEEQKRGLKLIGVKVTERLRFKKGQVYVERIERPQYVVDGEPEQGVKSAPAPLAIVEGSKYDFSVVAAMAGLKYAIHVPTYRQQDYFAQCGWFPSRSTVNDLLNYAVATIEPLYQQMWRLLLQQPILLGDDTHLRVLLRDGLTEEEWAQLSTRKNFRRASKEGPLSGNGVSSNNVLVNDLPGSATSYAWLYTSLDLLAPYNVFHWSLTHQNAVIDGHLATYRGIFVGDAAGANARLQQRSDGRIIHASCNMHARREFIQAESNDPILASQAISFYQQLYDIEERGKTMDLAALHKLRKREAVPIWNRMHHWLDGDAARRALPRSRIGEALGYLRNHWSALTVYLSDPRIPIDNAQSEQTLRPLTVGRNNWLSLGHPQAAAGRLQLYSIVSSAHRHHLMIDDYLEDVLYKLADAQQNHPADLELDSTYLTDLLPDRWAAAHPQSVRKARAEDRLDAYEAKRLRRAKARLQARPQQPGR